MKRFFLSKSISFKAILLFFFFVIRSPHLSASDEDGAPQTQPASCEFHVGAKSAPVNLELSLYKHTENEKGLSSADRNFIKAWAHLSLKSPTLQKSRDGEVTIYLPLTPDKATLQSELFLAATYEISKRGSEKLLVLKDLKLQGALKTNAVVRGQSFQSRLEKIHKELTKADSKKTTYVESRIIDLHSDLAIKLLPNSRSRQANNAKAPTLNIPCPAQISGPHLVEEILAFAEYAQREKRWRHRELNLATGTTYSDIKFLLDLQESHDLTRGNRTQTAKIFKRATRDKEEHSDALKLVQALNQTPTPADNTTQTNSGLIFKTEHHFKAAFPLNLQGRNELAVMAQYQRKTVQGKEQFHLTKLSIEGHFDGLEVQEDLDAFIANKVLVIQEDSSRNNIMDAIHSVLRTQVQQRVSNSVVSLFDSFTQNWNSNRLYQKQFPLDQWDQMSPESFEVVQSNTRILGNGRAEPDATEAFNVRLVAWKESKVSKVAYQAYQSALKISKGWGKTLTKLAGRAYSIFTHQNKRLAELLTDTGRQDKDRGARYYDIQNGDKIHGAKTLLVNEKLEISLQYIHLIHDAETEVAPGVQDEELKEFPQHATLDSLYLLIIDKEAPAEERHKRIYFDVAKVRQDPTHAAFVINNAKNASTNENEVNRWGEILTAVQNKKESFLKIPYYINGRLLKRYQSAMNTFYHRRRGVIQNKANRPLSLLRGIAYSPFLMERKLARFHVENITDNLANRVTLLVTLGIAASALNFAYDPFNFQPQKILERTVLRSTTEVPHIIPNFHYTLQDREDPRIEELINSLERDHQGAQYIVYKGEHYYFNLQLNREGESLFWEFHPLTDAFPETEVGELIQVQDAQRNTSYTVLAQEDGSLKLVAFPEAASITYLLNQNPAENAAPQKKGTEAKQNSNAKIQFKSEIQHLGIKYIVNSLFETNSEEWIWKPQESLPEVKTGDVIEAVYNNSVQFFEKGEDGYYRPYQQATQQPEASTNSSDNGAENLQALPASNPQAEQTATTEDASREEWMDNVEIDGAFTSVHRVSDSEGNRWKPVNLDSIYSNDSDFVPGNIYRVDFDGSSQQFKVLEDGWFLDLNSLPLEEASGQ